MTTLTPTGGGRRSSSLVPAVVAAVVALVIGVAAGMWLTGGGSGDGASTSPSPTLSCPPSSTGKPVPLPANRTITVNVYNATDRSGLARSTATDLGARGFRVAKVANDPLNKTVAASAEVRHGPKGAAQAKVVAAQVPGAVLVVDKRTDATVDLVLGEAFAGVATPAQVASALAPAPVPSGC